MSLIEALALVRGINNEFADDAGIFLFRYEDSLVASALRQTDSRNVPNNKASSEFCNSLLEQGKRSDSVNTTSCTHGSFKDAKTPVVYRLDFGKGDAFFLAQIFKIRDKDVLYVAQHPVAEFSRFISMVVSPLLGTAKASSF